ncbi:related to tyrosinase precursor (monophenol monooxygenase) [Rhynchosporium graminicola]|uniref:Related to tyrosinase (Monophenol monooxygenase) n=1 Tax=Rhynchosporium graminicola TaxID=2792576 RepID=A0A1E1LTR2_9HELO|nr:related to tyrosinase precursor (monophenol monooxygenase) [Rhynchosporium commune]
MLIPTPWNIFFIGAFLRLSSNAASSSKHPYSSYDYGADPPRLPRRQNSESFLITGVHTGNGTNGSLPLRIEVRDLEKDPVAWNLFILGLDMLQYTPQADTLSWYQIAGIHGRPFVPFDNVQPKPGNENNGYCNHVSILFPTWHRPYLALYEQAIHEKVQMIAQQYPAGQVRDQYVAAAANFRIPYWDWAMSDGGGGSILPDSVMSPTVVVNGPAGAQTIANPLYSYRFQPLDPAQLPDYPFNEFVETVRYPATQNSTAASQNTLIARQLDNSGASFRNRLYLLLTMYDDYTTFSNEAWVPSDKPAAYDSLESLHDQIHGLTGSGGHMTYIHYSGFDPLFWLHHAMIDRIFAMWQVIHPHSYVVPEPAIFNTFTTSAGDIQDINSPLTPFRKDAFGGFWTSESARKTEVFGYQYPETVSHTGSDVRTQVISAVNQLYGSKLANLSFKQKRSSTPNLKNDIEWIANIRVKKYALNVPFYIHIFIGPFSRDPYSWSFESNLVGTHSIFVKSIGPNETCNCDTEQLVTATIPLTEKLAEDLESGRLRSLGEEDVTLYLARTFAYRVSMANDTKVENVEVPSLKVSIVSIDVERGKSDELPVWGKMRGHMDVSAGS